MAIATILKLGVAAGIAAAAIVVAVWAVWFRGGVQAGPGPFAAEVAECQHRLDQDLQHPQFFQFLDETVWHLGTAAELHVGGKVVMLADNGRPTRVSYECLARNGRVLNVEAF